MLGRKRRTASRLALSTVTVIAVLVSSISAMNPEGNPSASGHATFFLSAGQGLEGRSIISFNAVQQQDGTVNGNAEFQLANVGRVHADINCLRIVGNEAFLTGLVTNSNTDRFPEGSKLYITAQDNGEGVNDPPDRVQVLVISPSSPIFSIDCNTTLRPGRLPVERGNISVNP
jgi:hypothetical protein